MTIQQQIAAVIAREGNYSNNPADTGGPTRWGITEAIARAEGYTGDMRQLPQSIAAGIYLKRFWTAVHFDLVAAIAPTIAAELFDTGVNCGPATAVQLLQRALNGFMGSGLNLDGTILPKGATLTILGQYLAARRSQDGEAVLLELMSDLQGERYLELVERIAKDREFLFGWIRNRVMAPATA